MTLSHATDGIEITMVEVVENPVGDGIVVKGEEETRSGIDDDLCSENTDSWTLLVTSRTTILIVKCTGCGGAFLQLSINKLLGPLEKIACNDVPIISE